MHFCYGLMFYVSEHIWDREIRFTYGRLIVKNILALQSVAKKKGKSEQFYNLKDSQRHKVHITQQFYLILPLITLCWMG